MFYASQALGTFEEVDEKKFKLKLNEVFKGDFKNGPFPLCSGYILLVHIETTERFHHATMGNINC